VVRPMLDDGDAEGSAVNECHSLMTGPRLGLALMNEFSSGHGPRYIFRRYFHISIINFRSNNHMTWYI
jgi:hypothetical protein